MKKDLDASAKASASAGRALENLGALALEWVAADTKAKALRKVRAEIISRYGGCSRKNERGPEGYCYAPCYTESHPNFEGCACCNESQPTHLAYHAAATKAGALRRAMKRAARILAAQRRGEAPAEPPPNPPLPKAG